MNQVLIKNEIARVEKALAARLHTSQVNIFTLNMMDRNQWSPLEFKTLNRFIALANSASTMADVVNEIVATSNQLIALFDGHRKTGSKFGRVPAVSSPDNAQGSDHYDDEYLMGRAGIRTGSAENLIGRHRRDD